MGPIRCSSKKKVIVVVKEEVTEALKILSLHFFFGFLFKSFYFASAPLILYYF